MISEVRVHPIFYARLYLIASNLGAAAFDVEAAFILDHLDHVKQSFIDSWDDLPGPPDDEPARWVDGRFLAFPALFMVEARLVGGGVVELRNFQMVLDPIR